MFHKVDRDVYLYACQLFLSQMCEIFMIRVLGLPKTFRLFTNIAEDVSTIPERVRKKPEHL